MFITPWTYWDVIIHLSAQKNKRQVNMIISPTFIFILRGFLTQTIKCQHLSYLPTKTLLLFFGLLSFIASSGLYPTESHSSSLRRGLSIIFRHLNAVSGATWALNASFLSAKTKSRAFETTKLNKVWFHTPSQIFGE